MSAALAPQIRAWRGQADLGLVFWGHGVFVSGLLILAFVDALYRRNLMMQQALLVAFLLYTPWVLVAVWRCAAGVRAPWGTIARLLTVAWAGNTLLVVAFLQFELLQAGLA